MKDRSLLFLICGLLILLLIFQVVNRPIKKDEDFYKTSEYSYYIMLKSCETSRDLYYVKMEVLQLENQKLIIENEALRTLINDTPKISKYLDEIKMK